MAQRGLASLLTGLSMALGVALVVVVLVMYGVVNHHFLQGAQGFDLIVGAKGSKQQLVFNTVYHLDQPIENIPFSYYREFVDGRFAQATKVAIPYCLGDSFHANDQTFRVVGTTPELFEEIEYGRLPDGTPLRYQFQSGGRNFRSENFFEAVIGAAVARHSGLSVGDTFRPVHGIAETGADPHQHDAFTIVGVLQPTGTPNDRALFVNIEGFYLLEDHARPAEAHAAKEDHATPQSEHADDREHEHEHVEEHADGHEHEHAEGHEHGHEDGHPQEDEHGHGDAHGHGHTEGHGHHHDHTPRQPLPEEQREVTAVLVLMGNSLLSQSVFTMVNEGQVAQAVYPIREIAKFFDTFLGPIRVVLLLLATLVVIVAGVGILVSIYNSMSERRHEIAVMRALGASRGSVMAVILLESILLSFLGGLAGLVVGHALLGLVSPYLVERTGVSIGFLRYDIQELVLIPGLLLVASLVGFFPALAAYRTDVAKSLASQP